MPKVRKLDSIEERIYPRKRGEGTAGTGRAFSGLCGRRWRLEALSSAQSSFATTWPVEAMKPRCTRGLPYVRLLASKTPRGTLVVFPTRLLLGRFAAAPQTSTLPTTRSRPSFLLRTRPIVIAYPGLVPGSARSVPAA